MITLTDITLYHETRNPVTRLEEYTRRHFPEASMQKDIKSAVLSDGLKSADVLRIRIPTNEHIDIANGDKVYIGNCNDEKPPQGAFTVIGFADNRKGSMNMRHWKVICT